MSGASRLSGPRCSSGFSAGGARGDFARHRRAIDPGPRSAPRQAGGAEPCHPFRRCCVSACALIGVRMSAADRPAMQYGQLDDAALVEASHAGDRLAFSELVLRHQNLVRSITYSVSGNLADSEELAQESFIVAWSRL